MTVQVNGRLIRELRIKHSYSQEKLAEIVGVNLRTIQRIETNGVAAIHPDPASDPWPLDRATLR
jgi:DNA-binding XRE family transcriptional regulator